MSTRSSVSSSVSYSLDSRLTDIESQYILDKVAIAARSSQGESSSAYLINTSWNYLAPRDLYKAAKNHEDHNEHVLSFIKPDANPIDMVKETCEIQEYVEDIFKKVTGNPFPRNIELNVLAEKEFLDMHSSNGDRSRNVLGFSLNRNHPGNNDSINQVFVKEADIAQVLIVMGHEIGHVLSQPLDDIKDEEAKAFAFEYAWVEAMIEYDFAGLRESLTTPVPADNGLHNIASDFVLDLINTGKKHSRSLKR